MKDEWRDFVLECDVGDGISGFVDSFVFRGLQFCKDGKIKFGISKNAKIIATDRMRMVYKGIKFHYKNKRN